MAHGVVGRVFADGHNYDDRFPRSFRAPRTECVMTATAPIRVVKGEGLSSCTIDLLYRRYGIVARRILDEKTQRGATLSIEACLLHGIRVEAFSNPTDEDARAPILAPVPAVFDGRLFSVQLFSPAQASLGDMVLCASREEANPPRAPASPRDRSRSPDEPTSFLWSEGDRSFPCGQNGACTVSGREYVISGST